LLSVSYSSLTPDDDRFIAVIVIALTATNKKARQKENNNLKTIFLVFSG